MNKSNVLSIFDPIIASWFQSQYGVPTDIQQKAWPVIANGNHALISAPTGTGKTLTAFLWTLNQLITGTWQSGTVRTLYISPLKALNTDIRNNLLIPLHQLRKEFLINEINIPLIRVMTRSGDTPYGERQKMIKFPPEILITTPESLNLILSSPRARNMLRDVKTVILDEIHAITSDKRGSYLMTAVERLELFSKEFQRIALSATVRPLETVAAFVGGAELKNENGKTSYFPRPVQIVHSDYVKKISISVEGIAFDNNSENDNLWINLAERIREIIERNKATLIFVNNRRLAERLTLYINDNCPNPVAYSHHGSLSKELRLEVECKLKSGELRAIVATSTLEMGIDVGAIDEVVMVQTPNSISSTVQRIGRAGHSVHRISCGTIFPVHGLDYLNAAVSSKLSSQGNIEEVHLVRNPLDVLAQVILSMVGIDSWNPDSLFDFIKSSAPFFTLTRIQFDNVISMLTGRYQETRIRELRPRIMIDSSKNRLVAVDNLLSLVYSNNGTIPDKGYYSLRHAGSRALIGELDEEFVWERRVGDTFLLGTQNWRIEKIDSKDVEVSSWNGKVSMSPFWKAEAPNRSFHLSEAILTFLENWNERIDSSDFINELKYEYHLNDIAVEVLSTFLQVQKSYTGTSLPHRHHIIIEHVNGEGDGLEPHTLIHTLWGNSINYPFMLALSAAWEIRNGTQIETFSSNDLIFIGEIVDPQTIISLVNPIEINNLLRKSLEKSNFFGARFRENSARALLLPRFNFKKRMPFWITRERSKRLFDAVHNYDDFPMIIETWRTCLKDEFDLNNLTMLLNELRNGSISFSSIKSVKGSPFSGWMKWQITNTRLYQDDKPKNEPHITHVKNEILQSLVQDNNLRPPLKVDTIKSLERRLQRTSSGYAPSSALELIEWTKDRVFITNNEWTELLITIKEDNKSSYEQIITDASEKLCRIKFPGTDQNSITPIELIPGLLQVLQVPFDKVDIKGLDNSELTQSSVLFLKKLFKENKNSKQTQTDKSVLVAQWMEFYGPVDPSFINEVFGFDNVQTSEVISTLVNQQKIIKDVKVTGYSTGFICDSQNLERILRMMRNSAKSSFNTLPIKYLPLLLAKIQYLTEVIQDNNNLKNIIELYFGYQCRASLWESEIFASRLKRYFPYQIDSFLNNYELQWIGCAKKKITFCLAQNREAMVTAPKNEKRTVVLNDYPARYFYTDLLSSSKLDSSTFLKNFWNDVWNGFLTCDTFEAIRKGISNNYGEKRTDNCWQPADTRNYYLKPIPNTIFPSFNNWKETRLMPGTWYSIDYKNSSNGYLYDHNICKERVKQLLLRYGVIFKELLTYEMSHFQWGHIFKTLRIMELSGEIIAGQFFDSIPGLQFISPSALKLLENGLPEDAIYRISACDPASLCGIPVPALKAELPERIASTHLYYHGPNLVMISRQNGILVDCMFSPESPHVQKYLELLTDLAKRPVKPVSPLTVLGINTRSAFDSEYLNCFMQAGFKKGYSNLTFIA